MSPLRQLFGRMRAGATASRAQTNRRQAPNTTEPRTSFRETLSHVDKACEEGAFGKALAVVDRALDQAPSEPELLVTRGSVLYEWGRCHEAREWFLMADALGADDPELAFKLGWACMRSARVAEAMLWMQRAVQRNPQSTKCRFGLGIALQSNGSSGDASEHFEYVVGVDPTNFDAIVQLGCCRLESGNTVAAEQMFRQAIQINPKSATGWTNLGAALFKQDRWQESLEAFDTAEELERESTDEVDNFINFAVALGDMGSGEQALALYESNLSRRPSPRGYFGYAGLLLRSGKLTQGWRFYEYRWTAKPYSDVRAQLPVPTWNGQDLHGRSILVHAEQGFGDSFQFIRYAALLKALGARVLFRAVPGLETLAERVHGIDRVIRANEPLPSFDFHINLLSLPRVFRTERDSIPSDTPYLYADAARVNSWKQRLGFVQGIKVGLVWAGNPRHERDRYRSIDLGNLESLARIPNVQLISLQKGPATAQLVSAPFASSIMDVSGDLRDFEDTAAVIEAIDLVIAVDTAVLHLAGALGKPVWGLLATPNDFRWLENRADSPWYRSMRLFRQTRPHDWSEVVDGVASQLRDLAAGDIDVRDVPRHDETARPARTGVATNESEAHFALVETRHGLLQFRPGDQPVGASLNWYGEYLQPQVDVVTSLLRAGNRAVEVGAGMGQHAVPIAKFLGPDGHLILYENDAVLRRVLQQNLGFARVNNATVMSGDEASWSRHEKPVESIDELRLTQLELLKVNDTVSADLVVAGAVETIWRLRPKLFLSVQDSDNLDLVCDRVKSLGYTCFRFESPVFNPSNFNRRDDNIFDSLSALALIAIPEELSIDFKADSWSVL